MSEDIAFDIIARDKASAAFNKTSGSAKKLESATSSLGGRFDKLGTGLAKVAKNTALGLGAATVAGGLFLAKVGGPYVDSLNKIQTLTDASNARMKDVAKTLESNSALYAKMGQTTGDASAGVVELTKAGQTLGNAMKSVNATMILAKAGEMSVADASSLVANTLNTFSLKAKSAGKIANYLANAANISSADVSDLAESLKYVAPVAASTHVSLKLTSAILAELSNSGIQASNAGTGFRKFLLSLQAPSVIAAADLKELNVTIFDSAGKMKPLPAVIDQLGGALSGLADEKRQRILKDIFGLQGVSSAQVILKNGSDGLAKYARGIDKAGAAQRLANSASKGLMGTLGMLRAEIVSMAQAAYRKLSPVIDNVLRPFVAKLGELPSVAGPAIKRFIDKLAPVAGKVRDAFGKINITGLGSRLAKQAQGWAAPVIGGFKTGLNTGDWSGLGKALGTGIIRALSGLTSLVGQFGKVFGDLMSKVDWVGIGIAMGKQAPSLLIGLVAGIANFDLMGLLRGVAQHWQDILLAVLAIAFTPGKIIGKVGELLARIPLVGKLLEWALLHFKKFSDGLVRMVGKAIGGLGRAFLTGFRRVFPGVGKGFAEALGLLPIRIGIMAIELQAKGLKMILGLAKAIGKGIFSVVAKIGELIGKMLKPFADSASWLLGKGAALIRGLLSGIRKGVGALWAWLHGLGGKILAALGDIGSLLIHAGEDLIGGFIKGIGNKIGDVKNALGSLTGKLTSWKGPPAKDRLILKPAGILLIEGLIDGIESKQVAVKTVLEKLTDYISRQSNKIADLMGKRSDIISSFQDFTSSVFSAEPAEGQKTDVASLLAYQQKELAKAARLKRDVAKLLKAGLSRNLIQQMAAAGESGMDQIHALAAGTPAQIKQLNALNAQTQQALTATGTMVGNNLYAADIKASQKDLAVAKAMAAEFRKVLREEKGHVVVVVVDESGHTIHTKLLKEKDKLRRGLNLE